MGGGRFRRCAGGGAGPRSSRAARGTSPIVLCMCAGMSRGLMARGALETPSIVWPSRRQYTRDRCRPRAGAAIGGPGEEEAMYEVFPLAAGVVVALLVYRLVPARLRGPATIGLSIVLGVVATAMSGAALASWLFALVDTRVVLAAARADLGLPHVWQ